ncbi:hypothetical protein A3C91_03060 [Candidatus Azambacteria bacterium RIFCSPHIGHO2_02_FULL_52_12]|uniref:Peptidase M3A/M3B catalytic domain-containing protein n=1 Tax=Candidatus Azambacteria bacterium RIFCSPLOWO2_01_FULL_46_25 TaxID=1797298 RepID=A0A1F5BT63_9BACT|nr:MAG: hypothetical protein A3C91_03060 [Candidatus Azambacteria bacterium RIFCSPHIGHO2_02_FULL_52_12]OGD33813.1 MAG: hypothetical protein A2988_01925 [Candidatus Azambacteria bacterium RIFCSPLOWO2_01_FULL_46_25]
MVRRREYAPQDFAWTQWNAEQIRAMVPEILARKKERYAAIKAIPDGERTFENTIYAIESAHDAVRFQINAIHFLMNVSPDKAVRETAQEAIETLEKEFVDVEYDEGMYRAVRAYADKQAPLEGADKKLFDDMFRDYRRMGFELAPEKQEKLKENLKKIAELSNRFSTNINKWQDHIAVTRHELDGLPERYISGLKKDENENYKVTLAYPDIGPFMKHAHNAAKRKELLEKEYQKGGAENTRILKEVLLLRDENAKLLGYGNHADFQTEVRMAKNAETVAGFLDDLTKNLKEGVQKELAELRDIKRKITGDKESEVENYDVPYLSERLRQERFSVDSEKVREYFPFEIVKQGMFSIYEKLFSVKFERMSGIPAWHEDVEAYGVSDANGSITGYFMLDLYPRENKYGHAAVFDVMAGRKTSYAGEEYVSPLACMVANFPKPNAEHPSLLSHREVDTFFHEFGHVVHDVLTAAPYASQSGTSVARDFVEAPSQMLENWVWHKETLVLLSGHYLNHKEKMPDELLSNLIKTKKHMIAYDTMRQLVFGLLDLSLHTTKVMGEPNLIYHELVREYNGVTIPKESIFPAGFGHMMGYDAGYYGYMWSLVYAADMFTRFEKEGLLNPKTGMEYRQWILEKGSSMEEMDLVRGFLSREPNSEAFLKEIGIRK